MWLLAALELVGVNLVSSARIVLYGTRVYNWRTDFFALTKAGFVYEAKLCPGHDDFIKDLGKKKIQTLTNAFNKNQFMRLGRKGGSVPSCPNYYYYVTPPGVVGLDEVPGFAGLVYAGKRDWKVVREAPVIHDGRFDAEKFGLLDRVYAELARCRKILQSQNWNQSSELSTLGLQFGCLGNFKAG